MKSDIFSLGVIFFNLLTGKTLFWGENREEVLYQNRTKDAPKIVDKTKFKASKECKDLMKKMLQVRGEQRLSTKECLAH